MCKRLLTLALVAVVAVACHDSGKGGGKIRSLFRRGNTPSDMRNQDIKLNVEPSVPAFLEKSGIGSKLAADGTTSDQERGFASNEPVYVTMWFRTSPKGLQSSVAVVDQMRKNVHREMKQMNGAKVVTFKLPPLKPGPYKIEGYWGGNVACEYEIVVQPGKKH